jgi:hypothetical protein
MEGADPHSLAGAKPFDATSHLVGGLVGEGESENLSPRDPYLEEIGDAMGHNPGFAAAGAGQDEEWPFNVENRLALGVGQAFQK